jgi:hypothetical protein
MAKIFKKATATPAANTAPQQVDVAVQQAAPQVDVAVHPVLAIPSAAPASAPAPKKAKVRYAPVSVLENSAAVITSVAPNPKLVGSDSHALYAQFMVPAVGLTIAQFEQKFVDAGKTKHRARRLLRWDFAHGFITIEAPVAAPAAPAAPVVE